MTKIKIVDDIPKKFFGGTRGQEVDQERFPLAFLTVLGTTKADLKRQETVRSWSSWGSYEPDGVGQRADGTTYDKPKYVRHEGHTFELENEWLQGFTFDKVVSRYRTDNKVFRVQDPRGFSLEIYADCMIRVLQSATIVKGEIQDRCCWARCEGKMYLLVENSEEHIEYQQLVVDKQTKPVAGDIIDMGDNYKHIFLGDFYAVRGTFERVSDYSYYSSEPMKYEFRITTTPKPWRFYCFAGDLEWSEGYLSEKREWGKKDRTVGKVDPETLAAKLDELIIFDRKLVTYGDVTKKSVDRTSDFRIIFRTKADFDAYVAAGEAENWKTIKDGWRNEMESQYVAKKARGVRDPRQYILV